jgi:hypothetical protein
MADSDSSDPVIMDSSPPREGEVGGVARESGNAAAGGDGGARRRGGIPVLKPWTGNGEGGVGRAAVEEYMDRWCVDLDGENANAGDNDDEELATLKEMFVLQLVVIEELTVLMRDRLRVMGWLRKESAPELGWWYLYEEEEEEEEGQEGEEGEEGQEGEEGLEGEEGQEGQDEQECEELEEPESEWDDEEVTQDLLAAIIDDPYGALREIERACYTTLGVLEAIYLTHQGRSQLNAASRESLFSVGEPSLLKKLGRIRDVTLSEKFWEQVGKQFARQQDGEAPRSDPLSARRDLVDHDICCSCADADGEDGTWGHQPASNATADSIVLPNEARGPSATPCSSVDAGDMLADDDILLPHGFGGIF